MIHFEWVKENTYNECFAIRNKLFDYDFTGNIYEKVAKKIDIYKYLKIDYAIIKNDASEIVGTIGYYISKDYPDRCWMGWYGILSDFRGLGYSDKILDAYIDYIKENVKEAKYLNVYTDYDVCKAAIHGYIKQGMVLEDGKFYHDAHCDKWCILGMSLGSHAYVKWEKDPMWCED